MTTITETPQNLTLADQLAAAEAAAVEPRQRVGALQAELHAAIAVGQFDRAHALQADVAAAREEYAIADAAVTALRSGQAAIERQRAADAQSLAQAQQRDQAERDLAAGSAAEQHAIEQIGDALNSMWAAIASAQRFFRAAQAGEHGVNVARRQQIEARRLRGDWPADHPGPAPARADQASGLVERDELVSRLAAWSR